MHARRNVLIFHLGALGDFILTWPLALALSRIHPHSRIFYVTHAQKGALAEKLFGIESIDIESGWHHLFGDPAKLPQRPANLLAGAHSIYSYIASDSDPWAANVRALAPDAGLCCLHPTPPADFDGHITDYHLWQLANCPVAAEAMRQMIRSINDRGLCPSPHHPTTPPPHHPILVHPGSGSPAKCWPSEDFLALALRLQDDGHAVRFVLGPVERERWPAELLRRIEAAFKILEPASYLDLHTALAGASIFLGNDSGPAHLAAVTGVNTFALFGPTSPLIWKPLGPRVRVLQREPLASLAPEEIRAWLSESTSSPQNSE